MKGAIKRCVLPESGPQRVPFGIARGITLDFDFDHDTRLYLSLYELEIDRHLRSMVASGMCVFDIGALMGYDALLLAKRTGGRVASFECDPQAAERLRRNCALNPDLERNITVVERMVGDGAGQLGVDEFAYSDAGFVPDFVKVDVDGGEASVLRSAHRLLSERRPGLIVETHTYALEEECGRLLIEHGYRPVIVNQRRILPDLRGGEMNRWLVAEPPSWTSPKSAS